jgi:Arabinose-binding domain of AraC transcription regulator, N-term/Biotin carboxylase C-terminal domain
MIDGVTQQVLPTATGFAARQAIAVLRKRNIEVAPLLRRVGLSEGDLDNRQRRISANAQAKLLECAAEALGDSAFGLHLAQQANLREAGVLFYVTSAARTLGETLPLYERYCRIVNEAVRVKPLRIQNGLIVEINFVGLSRHHFRQNVEFVLAANLKGMRENVGRNIRPIGVTFAHPRNSNLPEFERFFGCPVEYGSASDQWSFSNETLAVPLVTGDPYLLETLQPFCDQAAKERNTLLYQGCQISPFYDSLLGKLIVWDETRDGALRRMRRGLEELIVEGVATTARLHQDLAEDETVRKGDFHTRWLENWLSSRENLAAP